MLLIMTRRNSPSLTLLLLLLAAAPLLAQPRPRQQQPQQQQQPPQQQEQPERRRPETATPAPGAFKSPDAAQQAIPRPILEQMYQRELGEDFVAAKGAKLYDAHLLIEKFFSTPTAAERKKVVEEIEALKVDPNYVGRICRLRMYWPELQTGVYYVNERVGPHAVMYFIGVPKGYDRTRPWPLVLKLPGPHAFVTQPPPAAAQVVELYKGWINEELTRHPDAV